tara:strand:- start:306 stop:479 length:174 start_codon:yes stop_codon:yes gene_type:complete
MNQLANYSIKVNINPDFIRKNEIKVLKGNPQKLFKHIGDFSNVFTLENTLEQMFNDD